MKPAHHLPLLPSVTSFCTIRWILFYLRFYMVHQRQTKTGMWPCFFVTVLQKRDHMIWKCRRDHGPWSISFVHVKLNMDQMTCNVVCVCHYDSLLTGCTSKVNGLLGPCIAALFGADAVLAGCVHVQLQNVVLLHHWRGTPHETTALRHDYTMMHSLCLLMRLTCDRVPASVAQRFFRCEWGREFTFATV